MKKALFTLAKTPLGDLIVGLAFGKLSHALPVKKVKETDKVIAFWHPKPFWEKHILIVPKKAIKNLHSLKSEEEVYLQAIYRFARELVKELNWQDDYFLLVNGGSRQEVNQLHFHLARGREIGSPADSREKAYMAELYQTAKKLVGRHHKASAIFLQKKLLIDFARASRLLDRLEAEGVIGPEKETGEREIFLRQ